MGSIEIRLHGRGGQGGVTCAKILAAVYARLGKSIQTFGDYAGERSGAPVRAYTRVSDGPITNRNKVYEPDHLLVLDPTLLGNAVLSGLSRGGTLLLNTGQSLESFDSRFDGYRLATVDATGIARRHGIGTRSVVIVNTTIAGAFVRVHDLPLEALEESYRSLGLLSNFEAAKEAFEQVRVRQAGALGRVSEQGATALAEPPDVRPLDRHLESGPTGIQTGAWGTQRPQYVEKLAPCNAWCPAGNDVVGFIQAQHREGEAQAAAVLGRSTPLAAVCGRVCPAPCMEGCNRRDYDGSVHIRALERWVADRAPVAVKEVAKQQAPHRVAVIGGGPAGLSAAYALTLAGHHATIFDGERELGGVLRTGIPEYRLPRAVLDREIRDILALGVETRLGEFLSPERLLDLERDHDGLILATGLQKLRGLDVEGADLPGIEQGIHFLHRVNLEGGQDLHGQVIVLGGGNTAMDCARSALRAGAERVKVAYRRTRLEMPAISEEIDEAEHECVEFLFLRQPLRFLGRNRVEALELAEVELGEPDETGRRRPVVTERVSRVDCDQVLLALGQSAELSLLPGGWELRGAQIWRNGTALRVFAAGDFATGDGTVTHALGHGRRAAGLLLQALGEQVEVFERPDRRESVPVTDIRLDHFERIDPAREILDSGAERTRGFFEMNHGLRDAGEAERCFSCGHCTQCDTCLVYCPEGIISRSPAGYEVDYRFCKGCGLCVEECPRCSLEMRAS